MTTNPLSTAQLPKEGHMPSFEGANAWLNSPPLTAADQRGKVTLVQFWTYTCINWLRTFPYIRAWADAYEPFGLVVIGVHTPEFGFEHDFDNVRRAAHDMRVDYPIALDNDYAVWQAFANHYWPAQYFVDAQGVIRHHEFGEGEYERSERVIQALLADSGAKDVPGDPARVVADGFELAADWSNLETPETYVGYARAERFSTGSGTGFDERRVYTVPGHLGPNRWALRGDWTVGQEAAVLNEAHGGIAFRFHARDLHLILRSSGNEPVPFRVRLDGEAPGAAHGIDIDEAGNGRVAEPRMYQLIRQPEPIGDRDFEIEFLDAGVEAFAFTFG
jgi:thiol-disulfide isomerase/thioredoxin